MQTFKIFVGKRFPLTSSLPTLAAHLDVQSLDQIDHLQPLLVLERQLSDALPHPSHVMWWSPERNLLIKVYVYQQTKWNMDFFNFYNGSVCLMKYRKINGFLGIPFFLLKGRLTACKLITILLWQKGCHV